MTKVNTGLAESENDKIENFIVLSSNKNIYEGQKRMRNKEIIDKIFIRGLQELDKDDTLNPVEIKIGKDKILRDLQKYQEENYTYIICIYICVSVCVYIYIYIYTYIYKYIYI